MQTAIALNSIRLDGFGRYLEQSLRNPFVLDLSGCSLKEVILACEKAKSKLHPGYSKSLLCLKHNLDLLEEQYHVTLQPIQVTDIFWGYFIAFCQGRGLKESTIETLCNQLRSILNWGTKYNVTVSPTYTDFNIRKTDNQKIALTADDVSRITYFDIDRYYAKRRKDFREKMMRVRDMFVLSCNLFQRFSDMRNLSRTCFDRNIFRIVQQKTGNIAVVDIDKYAIDAKTTYRLLEKYNYEAPYRGDVRKFNHMLHILMRDIGFTEDIRIDERINGKIVSKNVPKWKLLSSHTARRTAITINVLRGNNIHAVKKCSGHSDLRVFDQYVRD